MMPQKTWRHLLYNASGTNSNLEIIHNGSPQSCSELLDCIKHGGTPNASVEVGKDVAMVAHMGNIAYRTQNKLLWDSKQNRFIENEAANQLIMPNYRAPWTLPNL